MKIEKSLETELGKVEFKGELSAEELDYVLQIGLNTLLVMGALKTKTAVSAEPPPEGTIFQ